MGTKQTESGAKEANNPEEIIDARCVVEFRPNNDWEGEYGFDWFRIGDHQEKQCTYKDPSNKDQYYPKNLTTNGANDGATHYVNDNIVGRYFEVDSQGHLKRPPNDQKDPDYPNYKCTLFTNTNKKEYYWADILAKYYTIKTIKGLNRNYIVPWISLFYNLKSKHSTAFTNFGAEARTSAIVKMIIKKDSTNIKQIRKIRIVSLEDRIRFGKGNKQWKKNNKVIFNYIEFEGPFNLEQEIILPINLIYSLTEDWPIKAYAFYYGHDNKYYTLSGQINVVKSVPQKANILFVNVNVGSISKDDSGHETWSLIVQGMNLTEQEKNLEKYLSQATVVPTIEKETLSLYVDERRNMIPYEPNNPNNNIFLLDSSLGISKNVAFTSNRGYVFLVNGGNRTPWLGKQLENMINGACNGKYTDYYKIFFLNSMGVFSVSDIKKINSEGSLGGIATDIGSKSAIVFGIPSDETVCHELLHCFGLYHTFSNQSQFTYKKCTTSNIMDYGFVGGKYNCLKRISLSRWQWSEIRNNLENR